MTNPANFPSTTPRFNLPLLFAGQTQKEFFVNQAISMIDGLTQTAVEAAISAPPTVPSDGECYRITSTATDDWAGKEDLLAFRVANAWQYVQPADGMMVFDRAERRFSYYDGGWKNAAETAAPTGGGTIDAEARAAIGGVIEALRIAGILPTAAS